ncbi:MAG: hypothetical protein JNJ58_10790 [Chitinophagaceae bacterium]|nr:hypothetical protein [Chitinophagaceae bacterium]
MSICIAIAVPDGIAIAADSQTTWNKSITQVLQKDTNQMVDLAQPIQLPISWSRMARKLFQIRLNDIPYAICTAGIALINHKTIYSLCKALEKKYTGDGTYEHAVRYILDGMKAELRKQFKLDNLADAHASMVLELVISGFDEQDVSKPHIESWMIFSGKANVGTGTLLDTGEYRKWSNVINGEHTFGGCWIGRTEFISHLVTHKNPQMPPIQGQYELLSLADAQDYTRFLVDFTCEYQRFAAMVPDCGKPIIAATLTPEAYVENIIS